MFVKIFGSLLLLGFVCIQIVNSLECYSCDSAQSCKSPGKITCNPANSEQTIKYVNQSFVANFTNISSSNFECLFLNYTSVQYNSTYKGCIYNNVKTCSLTPRLPSLVKQKCYQCNTKLCNPAATFSSSMFTVFAAIIVVTVYKALNL